MTSLVFWSFFYLVITFVAQTILHELGHYVFGRITGYRFLVFRIFSFAVVKEEKRCVIKYQRSPGAFGQCLMLPPDKEAYPYVLVTIGGVILNALTAAIAMNLLWLSWECIPQVHAIGLMVFSFYGIGFAVINLIPNGKSGAASDGSVLADMKRDTLARACNRAQLQLALELMEGKVYGEMDAKLLTLPMDADLTNSLIGYHKILECYHYMDQRKWEKACRCLDQFYPVMDKVPAVIRNVILSEQFFISILRNDTTIKDSGMLKSMGRYFKGWGGDMNYVRVRSAYEIFLKREDREKILLIAEKLKRNYIYRGEAIFCSSLIKELLPDEGMMGGEIWIRF